MAREVIWTGPAWEDLQSAAEYIRRGSEAYAEAFLQEVYDVAESLAQYPERGLVVPEIGEGSIREVLVTPYRVAYRVTEDQVLIVAVIHGARRYRRT